MNFLSLDSVAQHNQQSSCVDSLSPKKIYRNVLRETWFQTRWRCLNRLLKRLASIRAKDPTITQSLLQMLKNPVLFIAKMLKIMGSWFELLQV